MDQCEVEHCGRVANLGGFCLLHRRKDIAGQLEYADGLVYDLCNRGHRWVPSNTHWESDSKGGKRRRCKQCLRDKSARRREEVPEASAPEPMRPESAEHEAALDLFDEVQEQIDGLCRDKPEQWMDFDAKNIPKPVKAALMCAGCPLLESCGNSARAQNGADPMSPGWGVWAGEVWVYGKRYTEGGKELINADD